MSRTEWILGGLLALLIMLVMGMGLFLWLQPDLEIDELPAGDAAGLASNPGVAPTALFPGDTAVTACGQAQGVCAVARYRSRRPAPGSPTRAFTAPAPRGRRAPGVRNSCSAPPIGPSPFIRPANSCC